MADSFANGGKGTQNAVTCLYRANVAGASRVITVTWCKTVGGQGLSVNVDDTSSECACKVDTKPWLFWKKKGSKIVDVGEHKVEVLWDLSSAKYGSSPEPSEGFYLAVVSGRKMRLLLGDMPQEAYKRASDHSPCEISSSSSLISRREHIFGKTFYSTKAQFGESGPSHDISIEYWQTAGKEEAGLCVRLDKQLVVQVKRLMWKFRGNQTIMVDGFPVELLWDVHNWLFNPSDHHNHAAVFMFQSAGLLDLPSSSSSSSSSLYSYYQLSTHYKCHGFSLLLYAWKLSE